MRKAENLPPSCAVVTKSGNLNFLEPSGPVQACNGTALPLPCKEGWKIRSNKELQMLKKVKKLLNMYRHKEQMLGTSKKNGRHKTS